MSRAALRRLDPTWPRVVHPVVVPHPITGERGLYVNEMQVAEILGLDDETSDRLLDRLLSVLYDDVNIYEHEWRNGDLVVWDNLSVQHARRAVAEVAPRTLRRVVFGEKAPWEQWPWGVEAAVTR
jgi:taurine dioxygenase